MELVLLTIEMERYIFMRAGKFGNLHAVCEPSSAADRQPDDI